VAENRTPWMITLIATTGGGAFALWYFLVKRKKEEQPPQPPQCPEGQVWDPVQNKCVPATTRGPKSSLGSIQISPI